MATQKELLQLYPASTKEGVTLRATLRVRAEIKRNGYAAAIERFCTIKDKAGKVHKIILNDEQHQFLAEVEAQLASRGYVRIIILKARQIGFSTAIQCLNFIRSFEFANCFSTTTSYDKEQALYLHGMLKRCREGFPGLDIPLVVDRRESSEYHKPLASELQVLTAGSASGGRGRTGQLLHASEVAFYPDAGTYMLGLLQAFPEAPGNMCFMETTANGVGNYFYNQWNLAVAGQSDWKAMFFPWWTHKPYQIEFHSEAERESFARSLSTYESDLLKMGATLEGLKWRRWMIPNKCDNDPRLFQQEYPATAEEAFLTSGRPTFDPDRMRQLLELCRKNSPLRTGHLESKEIVGVAQ